MGKRWAGVKPAFLATTPARREMGPFRTVARRTGPPPEGSHTHSSINTITLKIHSLIHPNLRDPGQVGLLFIALTHSFIFFFISKLFDSSFPPA